MFFPDTMALFTCHRCKFASPVMRMFVKHLRRHERTDPYITFPCAECHQVFSDSRTWQRHMYRHTHVSKAFENTTTEHAEYDQVLPDHEGHDSPGCPVVAGRPASPDTSPVENTERERRRVVSQQVMSGSLSLDCEPGMFLKTFVMKQLRSLKTFPSM